MSNRGRPTIIGVTNPAATKRTVTINVTMPETINAFSVLYIFNPVNIIINVDRIIIPPNHWEVSALALFKELNISVGGVIVYGALIIVVIITIIYKLLQVLLWYYLTEIKGLL